MSFPVISSIVSQHAEEAAFLWLLRSHALRAPHYALKDLAKLDGRVEAHLDGLPQDRIAGHGRSRQSLKHAHNVVPGLGATINYNRVSDDAYFRDLADAVNATSQTHLLREGELTYSNNWWSASARVQRFQTLQDPAAVVAVPYHRAPQLSVDAHHPLGGSEATFSGEFVKFTHPTSVNGRRTVLYPSVSYPH